MKVKNIVFKNIEKALKSNVFKYLFIALALLNILVYITTKSILCFVSFILAYGASDNWVSKNIGINLLVALFVSNIIFNCGRIKENFVVPKHKHPHKHEHKHKEINYIMQQMQQMRKKNSNIKNN